MTAGEGRGVSGCERQPLRSIHMESWHSPLTARVRFPALQALNFRSAQIPELPGLEAAVCEEGKPHSLELHHALPRAFKHSAYLVVTAFHEGDFIPGLIAFGNHANLARRRGAAVQHDAVLEAREIFWRWLALQLDVVSARNSGSLGSQKIGEIAVVRQQQQAGRVVVKPADGVNALLDALEQLHNRGSALGIMQG